MSDINDDREVIKKGRTRSLKGEEGVEASLRDQIPTLLARKLEEMKVGVRVNKLWYQGNGDRSTWLNRRSTYLKDWDEFLEVNAQGAFQHSSNLHLPMPYIVAKTYHARFLQAISGEDRINAKARREDAVDRAPLIEQLLNYTVQEWANCNQGIDETLDQYVWDWIVTGVGIDKWRWDVQFSSFMDVEESLEPGPPNFEVDGEGNEIAVPTTRLAEKEKRVTKKIFEGPVRERVDPADLLIIGGEGDVQKADALMHRQYLTASELWTLADRKIFKESKVKFVINSGQDEKGQDQSDNIKFETNRNAGMTDLVTEADLDRYQIIEAYLQLDVDGSGINSDVVVWVHLKTSTILRATYLHRINKAGTRPFTKADFAKRPGETYGPGLIEILHPLTKELDAIHNMRVDFGILSTMPFGFYRASSSLDPETIQLEPGALIPVDNPQTDVFFPTLGNRTSFGAQEESALFTMIERLTGISDLTLGVMSGSQGATRTATGARALVGESNANLDVHLRRLNRALKQSYEHLLHMLQQRLPDGFAFRVVGDHGDFYWENIKGKEDIEGDFDFQLSPNTSDSNPAVRQQVASQIMQIVSNPIDIQMGIVNQQNIYEARKNFLQSLGVKEFNRYISKPAQNLNSFTPEEEFNRVVRGQPVDVSIDMDHEGYIVFWENFKSNDELLGSINEEQTVAAEQQSLAHQQALQAIEAQNAQQRNQQQVQANASLSTAPAPSPIGTGGGGGGPEGGQ